MASPNKKNSVFHLIIALGVIGACIVVYLDLPLSTLITFILGIAALCTLYVYMFFAQPHKSGKDVVAEPHNPASDSLAGQNHRPSESNIQHESSSSMHQLATYESELEMAKRVQQGLLSVYDTDIEGVTISKKCIPASSVSGDFFCFSQARPDASIRQTNIPGVTQYQSKADHFLGIGIGDVAGHGLSSALVMALASGVINEASHTTSQPSKILEKANRNLSAYIKNSHIKYVTAFFASLNIETKQLSYAKAGHPPAFIVRDDAIIELAADGIFLGMYSDEVYEEKTIQLQRGDRLFIYTDGLIETRNPQGEQFGIENLHALALAHASASLDHLETLIFDELRAFENNTEVSDDQTLVMVEIND